MAGWKIHEDTLVIGEVPIDTPILSGFPIAMFDSPRVLQAKAAKMNQFSG